MSHRLESFVELLKRLNAKPKQSRMRFKESLIQTKKQSVFSSSSAVTQAGQMLQKICCESMTSLREWSCRFATLVGLATKRLSMP